MNVLHKNNKTNEINKEILDYLCSTICYSIHVKEKGTRNVSNLLLNYVIHTLNENGRKKKSKLYNEVHAREHVQVISYIIELLQNLMH